MDATKSQNPTEFVCEEQFNEIIKTFVNNRHDKDKPLWTRQRIEDTITAIEQFKLTPLLRLQGTGKQYYYGKKYEVMAVGSTKILILKRNSDSDPVVKIVPTEDFFRILRETHQSTGHGGRDKMLHSLKLKYLIPTSVVLEFLKICTICQSRKGIVLNQTLKHQKNCNTAVSKEKISPIDNGLNLQINVNERMQRINKSTIPSDMLSSDLSEAFDNTSSSSSSSSDSPYQPSEYVYWHKPKELVNRLRFLWSSKMAGYTEHDKEILSIIEQLREEDIIY